MTIQSVTQRPLTSYRGRFAPSPSGFLHFGSLIAALASYLDAKANNGKWLIRIEDIDPPREKPGASAEILRTLEAYGLHWDEEVLYQSQQTAHYQLVLNELAASSICYACQCTRASIKKIGGIYQGHCRDLALPLPASLFKANDFPTTTEDVALRIKNTAGISQYTDIIQGKVACNQALAEEDFIIHRKDGLFAYQLAVVVDDIYQGISHVVRGCDLLEPTARQLSLYEIFGIQAPSYAHVPLAVTDEGYKLSKQNKAPAIDNKRPQPALVAALKFLGQNAENALLDASVEELLQSAISHWRIDQVPKQAEISL